MNLPSPIRVALVDDHSLVRDGIKALLAVMSPLDMVGEAENGAEALDLIDHTQGIELLLSDVVMPGSIDGLQVVAHARAKGSIPRIVLMSAFVPNRAVAAEVPFLQKPFSRAELLLALSNARP